MKIHKSGNEDPLFIGEYCLVLFSIARVFALSQAYQLAGDKIWERVNVEPSGTSFNSLVQPEERF